ncbi:MAG: amidohydrolase family protein, partial [Deltaproteobacteria bacterium]|nr:amidohydrolase family protein [Deltaproteobacteria bacterium]
MRILRGTGIALIVVLGAGAFFLHWAEPDTAPSEVVFVGGDIVTMAEPLVVEAMWIKDGRIEQLGSEDDLRAAAASDAKVVDLAGATLMPGFIEPHTHPLATALLGSAIDVSGFKHDSRAEVMETLREAMDGFLPQPWIIAFGWDPLMVRDLDPPTLAELDELSPDKPFVILTQTLRVLHSAAIKTASSRVPSSRSMRSTTCCAPCRRCRPRSRSCSCVGSWRTMRVEASPPSACWAPLDAPRTQLDCSEAWLTTRTCRFAASSTACQDRSTSTRNHAPIMTLAS